MGRKKKGVSEEIKNLIVKVKSGLTESKIIELVDRPR